MNLTAKHYERAVRKIKHWRSEQPEIKALMESEAARNCRLHLEGRLPLPAEVDRDPSRPITQARKPRANQKNLLTSSQMDAITVEAHIREYGNKASQMRDMLLRVGLMPFPNAIQHYQVKPNQGMTPHVRLMLFIESLEGVGPGRN